MKTEEHPFLSSARALAEFVAAWQTCTLTKSDFTHAAHVVVGAYYVVVHPSTAFQQMKSRLILFNESVGGVNSDTSGYHETITRLWIEVLAKFVATNAASKHGGAGYRPTWRRREGAGSKGSAFLRLRNNLCDA
jgi:hypothetical protein